ncbi:MAG: cytochrome c3 family protein [Deltaproteobacteria bacterium]|nr:cytochrome c3 family protein [Deltaproteobacteria bacterium]
MKKSYSFYMMIGALVASLLILLGMKYPAPLYSPGDVIEKHSKLRCKDCHAPFKRVPAESCFAADCHSKSIGKKDAIKDLHEKLKKEDCLVCHTDHKGRKGKVTHQFDHKQLPTKARCKDCHVTEGEKAHKGKYGNDCRSCHTTKNWKEITFKHEKVRAIACADCHKGAGEKAHPGKYGNACKGCHTTKDWKAITFSHDKVSATPCVDCHRSAADKAHPRKYGDACENCHNTKNWKKITFSHKNVTATPCADCHKGPKDELHTTAGNDCKACHSTKKWKPATIDHDRYFPLDKEHRVACNKCHETKNYKVYTCMNCHVHATRGIISEHREEGIREYRDCLRCHRVYMKGRTYGTDKTGENESMIDDDYRKGRRGKGDHDDDDDDDDHKDRRGIFRKWFGDNDDDDDDD